MSSNNVFHKINSSNNKNRNVSQYYRTMLNTVTTSSINHMEHVDENHHHQQQQQLPIVVDHQFDDVDSDNDEEDFLVNDNTGNRRMKEHIVPNNNIDTIMDDHTLQQQQKQQQHVSLPIPPPGFEGQHEMLPQPPATLQTGTNFMQQQQQQQPLNDNQNTNTDTNEIGLMIVPAPLHNNNNNDDVHSLMDAITIDRQGSVLDSSLSISDMLDTFDTRYYYDAAPIVRNSRLVNRATTTTTTALTNNHHQYDYSFTSNTHPPPPEGREFITNDDGTTLQHQHHQQQYIGSIKRPFSIHSKIIQPPPPPPAVTTTALTLVPTPVEPIGGSNLIPPPKQQANYNQQSQRNNNNINDPEYVVYAAIASSSATVVSTGSDRTDQSKFSSLSDTLPNNVQMTMPPPPPQPSLLYNNTNNNNNNHDSDNTNMYDNTPQQQQSLSVPKSQLHLLYAQSPRRKLISCNSYYSWNDDSPQHLLKWTTIFVCPINGELYFSGRYNLSNPTPTSVTRIYNSNDNNNGGSIYQEILWFTKKIYAEHGAAARAYDCSIYRDEQHRNRGTTAHHPNTITPVKRIGLEQPYMQPIYTIPDQMPIPQNIRRQIIQHQSDIRRTNDLYPV